MSAWKNTIDNIYIFGDKPYGNYWEEVLESDVPIIIPDRIPSVEEQLIAIRKAVISGDKTDIVAMDTALDKTNVSTAISR